MNTDTATIENAHEELAETVGSRREGVPCHFSFVEDAEQDTDAFHDALREQGWRPVGTPTEKRGDAPLHYNGGVEKQDSGRRLSLTVLSRSRSHVAIVPEAGYAPSRDDLASLLAAIEAGFGSPVVHESATEPEGDLHDIGAVESFNLFDAGEGVKRVRVHGTDGAVDFTVDDETSIGLHEAGRAAEYEIHDETNAE